MTLWRSSALSSQYHFAARPFMPRKLFCIVSAMRSEAPSRSWSAATRCAGDALRTPTTRPMAKVSSLASFRLRNMGGIALFLVRLLRNESVRSVGAA